MNHLEHVYNSDSGNASLDVVLENLGISLPQEGMVLDIGSGNAALLERQGMNANPDLVIVALDPFLHDAYYRKEHMTEDFGLTDLVSPEEVPSVAGVSQELPFKDESFNMVVSHAAVPTYLPLYPKNESEESFRLTFSEINRVLKPGGVAAMGPMEEEAYRRSLEVLDDMDYRYKAEEIPVQEYSWRNNPWFRITFSKQ
jgi:SAM-dependent methyltransferase